MFLRKSECLMKFLNTLTEESLTPNYDTVVSDLYFIEGKGLEFTFSSNVRRILYKDSSVDFSCKINGENFVNLVANLLENSEDVEVSISDRTLLVNNKYKFEASCLIDDTHFTLNEQIKFSKEQYDKLEKDYKYTTDFCFNTKITQTIGIANKEGKIYKLIPAETAYRIQKLDALIENSISRDFGFSTNIWLIPKKIYDLTKGEDVRLSFINDELVGIENKNILVVYKTEFGTKWFSNRLEYFTLDESKKIMSFSLFKNIVDNIPFRTVFRDTEDKNVNISITNKVLTLTIEDFKYSIDNVELPNIELYCNLNMLKELVKEIPCDSDLYITEEKNYSVGVLKNQEELTVFSIE